ncbi:Phosphate ABC transporter, periplasmic phosphate-binding protein PstS (TC 3.A.1.7.1) [hydrothermal vent metagenome]|uniref:Phosphate ABC transporter, periplasmic phosphate-binding protein PstS (TC 3.A.1.7.1) n=1 Tax=hydrothermal vent metagenome TaxID=652676 RepID=A0A3B0WWL8_9ZZZZ
MLQRYISREFLNNVILSLKYRAIVMKLVLSPLILFFSIFFAFPMMLFAENKSSDTITGAGAHFAWVIFDSLKEELEEKSGKNLLLFGKGSNIGMGCNAGIKIASQSTHDSPTFGFVCCNLSQAELDRKKLKIYPLADEPILILVNKNNPISNLSKKQVQSIFSGEIKNWNEVGGWNKPIVVITRLHCKKRPGHWKTILPSAKDFVSKRLNVSSAEEMVKYVTDFETAFGHIGSTWEFGSKSNVKAIKISNIEATAENLKNKTYPFHRRLSAITSLNPSDSVLTTINQVQQGKSFKTIAERFNLLPLN